MRSQKVSLAVAGGAGVAAPGQFIAECSRVFVQTCTKCHLAPFLQPPLALKRKQIGLFILGAVEGILGELRLLVAILALAGLALAGALFAGLLPGKTRAAVF